MSFLLANESGDRIISRTTEGRPASRSLRGIFSPRLNEIATLNTVLIPATAGDVFYLLADSE